MKDVITCKNCTNYDWFFVKRKDGLYYGTGFGYCKQRQEAVIENTDCYYFRRGEVKTGNPLTVKTDLLELLKILSEWVDKF